MSVCDKCRVARGIVLWWNEACCDHDGEILLCGHHSDELAYALVAQGFQVFEDERHEPRHPALAPLTSDVRTH
jgi:hypothetical protein